MTAEVVLSDKRVQEVDTIEIEPQVLAAGASFSPRFQRAVHDPRSKIHVEDARIFFALSGRSYDLIISEPSNPWVSGVAALFTRQYYRIASRSLADDGFFAQWVHGYEISAEMVASIAKAIAKEFPHYHLYMLSRADYLIVAGHTPVPSPAEELLFGMNETSSWLYRVHVRTPPDVTLRWLGDERVLRPMFDRYPIAANDDFYPVLDTASVRARFLGLQVDELSFLSAGDLPVQEMLYKQFHQISAGEVTETDNFSPSKYAARAVQIVDYIKNGDFQLRRNHVQLHNRMNALIEALRYCGHPSDDQEWSSKLIDLASGIVAYTSAEELAALWARLLPDECRGNLSPQDSLWLQLVEAISARDAKRMYDLSTRLLANDTGQSWPQRDYLLRAALLASLAQDKKDIARQVWDREGRFDISWAELPLQLRLLVALAQDEDTRESVVLGK